MTMFFESLNLDLSIKNKDGLTALQVAQKNGFERMVAILETLARLQDEKRNKGVYIMNINIE